MARPFVLVPLYIYPSEEAWEPLVQAARAYRGVDFVAVVNPANGPGPGRVPDGSYRTALRRLAAEPNISTLGYVHCSYGRRAAEAVRADADVYRGWCGEDRGLAAAVVGGVFFDEAPSDPGLAGYMASLADHVRTTWRRDLGRRGAVVFNPGVVVAADACAPADHVVVFEASSDQWRRLRRLGQGLRRMDAGVRPKAVAIIHSGPAKAGKLARLLRQTRSLGIQGVYVTDQHDGGYTRWPAAWMQFAEAVSRCE